MRFFKYLVFIFFFSTYTFADYRAIDSFGYNYTKNGSTALAACQNLATYINEQSGDNLSSVTVNNIYCSAAGGRQFGSVSYVQPKCPSQSEMGGMMNAFFDYNTPVPLKLCTEIEPNKFCVFEATSDNPLITNYPTRQHVTLWSKSTTPASTCTPAYKGVCDKNDPYGGCYTPPNDGCTRQYDGSIVCPPEAQPPTPEPSCGGATYCVRPPSGCGEGYVSGTFNGQQLCVKSGPSNPPEPEPEPEPNQCTAQYCPKSDPENDCPTGYYSSYYNGTAICVANNPNPNQPNQNDPNNNQNASSEPVGGDDPNTNFDVKGIIDAIKALRDSLLGSIENVSKKLTTLIDGQKTTNDHLTKLNEKSEKSNEHLKNIEDTSLAVSEAVGETNKKLDKINDSVQSQTNCLNQNYNPNDPSSSKYRQCTQEELRSLGETNASIPKREIGQQTFSLNLFQVNASNCPQDRTLTIPTLFGTFTKTVSVQDMCNETAWFGYIVLIIAYSFAVGIVLRA